MFDSTRIQNLVNETLTRAHVTDFCPISLNPRLTRSLGRAMGTFDSGIGKITNLHIEFSAKYITTCENDESVKQTILHECAHIIDYVRNPKAPHGHNWNFVKICREIGCTDTSATTINSGMPTKLHKYLIVCPKCGIIDGVDRQQNLTKHPEQYKCIACGTKGLSIIKNG